jgi:hypothetical protein
MAEKSLLALTAEFFERMGYTVDHNPKFEGFSGLLQTFDLLIKRSKDERPVLVKDWDRTVGVDIIIKVDKASEDVDLPNPIIVAERFSDHAKAYSNKRGITLITKREVLGQSVQFPRK